MTDARVVLTTISENDQAEKLARQLVERRLAACVNIIGPIRSVYRWEGNLQDEQEYLLVIKTTSERAAELRTALQDLHPYDVPECVQLAVEDGSENYLQWLAGEVSN